MISFDQLTEDIVLDCDVEPKTRFKLRSLRFSDAEKIEAAKDAAGTVPVSALHILSDKWKQDGDQAQYTDEERGWLDTNMKRTIAGEVKTCSLGVVEVDCHPVTPDQVEEMLDTIPLAMRDKVRAELARRVAALGAPAPKSDEQSE